MREARRILKIECMVTSEGRREWKTVVVSGVVESWGRVGILKGIVGDTRSGDEKS